MLISGIGKRRLHLVCGLQLMLSTNLKLSAHTNMSFCYSLVQKYVTGVLTLGNSLNQDRIAWRPRSYRLSS
jgi:hypothetical protein